jgi:hypothetical protein
MTARPAAWLGLGLALLAPAARGDDVASGEIAPGAYCPLPREGETPGCLEPARAEYGGFFRAVDAGSVDAADASRVEDALVGPDTSTDAYLALSSLAYGYYRLSQAAAHSPGADPAIAARLERWNQILSAAYAADPDDAAWRAAVREAALDLKRRAPPVELACRDAQGEVAACDSTDAMARGLDASAGEVGIRGGLERLLGRWFGGGAP